MRMTRKLDLHSMLLDYGLKNSPARLKILTLCVNAEVPLDVAQVHQKLAGKVHLATVYRTLERFVTAGLLVRIDFQEGKFRYEYLHSHHHHAVCESCGQVDDVRDTLTEIDAIENRVKRHSGFKVTKHTLELFGICRPCQQKGLYV